MTKNEILIKTTYLQFSPLLLWSSSPSSNDRSYSWNVLGTDAYSIQSNRFNQSNITYYCLFSLTKNLWKLHRTYVSKPGRLVNDIKNFNFYEIIVVQKSIHAERKYILKTIFYLFIWWQEKIIIESFTKKIWIL